MKLPRLTKQQEQALIQLGLTQLFSSLQPTIKHTKKIIKKKKRKWSKEQKAKFIKIMKKKWNERKNNV